MAPTNLVTLLLVAGALAFSGCVADDAPETQSVDEPIMEEEFVSNMTFERTGNAYRVANFCFDNGEDLPANAAGMAYTFENTGRAYIVWQDADGANAGTNEGAEEGTVPSGVTNLFVCNPLEDQTPVLAVDYTFQLWTVPEEMEEMDDLEAEGNTTITRDIRA